ncbi:MAG: PASTA domain-containing protein, partial [Clostridia bacterium]|nr:PASTA domain-containing protein [Clostridia bacterium]
IATLTGDEKSEAIYAARQLQWRNKAITDSYEPGSVFKVFTTAMALEEGLANEGTSFTCAGSINISGWNIRCHTRSHMGVLNLHQAISNSCNPYFMQLGLKLGANTFFKYFNGFGFTEKTGIDMNGEQDYRIFHSLETLQNSEASLATASFGQTFQVTPIQMITAMCAIANGGKLMTPYVVAQVLDAAGNVISTTEPKVKRQIISEETSERICKILGDIVNGGGSKNAYVAGYRVAGKTGTSEKRATVENTDDVIASFSGFAPADNPQVAVLVLLDDPQTDIRYGGTLSAPVAQKIFEAIMPHLGIEPSYTNEELSTLSRTTPSVTGQTTAVAQTKMANAGLKATIVGNGEKVVLQVPEAGQTIPAGGTVLLYTEEDDVDMVTVPDLTGLSVTEVNARAARLGLNVQMTGLVGGSSNAALSNKQSYSAGAEVPKGTVIEVNFYYQDTSEN